MGAARRFSDRHELVERFEDANRAWYVTVQDRAFLTDMREVSVVSQKNCMKGLNPLRN